MTGTLWNFLYFVTPHLLPPFTCHMENTQHLPCLSSFPYKEMDTHGPNFSKHPPDLIGIKEKYKVELIVSYWGIQVIISTWQHGRNTPCQRTPGNLNQTCNMHQTSSRNIKKPTRSGSQTPLHFQETVSLYQVLLCICTSQSPSHIPVTSALPHLLHLL